MNADDTPTLAGFVSGPAACTRVRDQGTDLVATTEDGLVNRDRSVLLRHHIGTTLEDAHSVWCHRYVDACRGRRQRVHTAAGHTCVDRSAFDARIGVQSSRSCFMRGNRRPGVIRTSRRSGLSIHDCGHVFLSVLNEERRPLCCALRDGPVERNDVLTG